jgi:cytochrome c oxidase subunit 3
MSAYSAALPEDTGTWRLPSRGRVGMWCLIGAESAIFTIFVVAYLFYIGKSTTGPQPGDVLHAPIFYTVCLLSSSVTIHLAVRGIAAGEIGAFARWWLATIVLGGTFLFGTAREWIHLIYGEGLTISTNLFGTTYYSLVGLHAFHVTMGLLALTIVAVFYFSARLRREHAERLEILSMYWHFVDAVWVVVFTVVYLIGVSR